ncbi:hypothetical protein [Sorangium sp. So ce542]|uniref:hypothetical protein n=1 Tax=Sorangium sp. So ce542 TaxID=3133316 RepID=UPI003F603142
MSIMKAILWTAAAVVVIGGLVASSADAARPADVMHRPPATSQAMEDALSSTDEIDEEDAPQLLSCRDTCKERCEGIRPKWRWRFCYYPCMTSCVL